jgi:predicted nucleic-acid-binding Zn-ribbon protein
MKKLIILLISVSGAFSSFAQDEKEKMAHDKMDSTYKMMYECPMHHEVKSDNPGKCPKCGMNMAASKNMTMKQQPIKERARVYTCTMHPEVISDKPGKCPKCGMTLVEKKQASGKKTSKE